jgi:hypothetical protein
VLRALSHSPPQKKNSTQKLKKTTGRLSKLGVTRGEDPMQHSKSLAAETSWSLKAWHSYCSREFAYVTQVLNNLLSSLDQTMGRLSKLGLTRGEDPMQHSKSLAAETSWSLKALAFLLFQRIRICNSNTQQPSLKS